MNLIYHFINARKTQEFAPDTVVFREGEPGETMYVLLEGMAKIMVRGRSVEIAGPGSIFGEMALIDDEPRSATVMTRSHCRAVSIGRRDFELLIRERPQFASYVMKVIVKRLRRMNTGVEDTARVAYDVDATVPHGIGATSLRTAGGGLR